MKNLFLIVLSCFSIALYGQSVHFGIEGGFNAVKSSFPSEPAPEDLKFSNTNSFIVGIPIDVRISQFFNIHSGVYFSQLGTSGYNKYTYSSGSGYSETNMSRKVNSIIIPLNYKIEVPVNTLKIIAGLGPQLQYNVSGRLKSNGGMYVGDCGMLLRRDEKLNMRTDLARFALGFDIHIGVQTQSGIFGKLFYTPGLTVVDNKDNHNERQQQLGVTAGYMF